MDTSSDKHKTIINEIERWRKSRLLPEHYCDFLLNLYLEDESEREALSKKSTVTIGKIRETNWKMWVLTFFSVCAISFIALNFTSFDLPLQIGVSALFLAGLYIYAGLKKNKEPMKTQILLGMASLFLLFTGVYMLHQNGIQDAVPTVGYVVLCSLIWMLTGILSRIAMFQLCGWVTLVFCYGWLLHSHLGSVDWLPLETSWVPLAVLFCWMAWMVHEKSRQLGFVFFLVSLIVWFMPELYGMLYSEEYGTMTVQWMLLGKIVIEGSLLYGFRKKWTEWVA